MTKVLPWYSTASRSEYDPFKHDVHGWLYDHYSVVRLSAQKSSVKYTIYAVFPDAIPNEEDCVMFVPVRPWKFSLPTGSHLKRLSTTASVREEESHQP